MLFGSLGGGSIEGGLFSQVLRKRLRILGTTLRSRDAAYKAALTAAFVESSLPRLASGVYTPVVDSEFELADGASAHARMESNDSVGKILLRVAAAPA